MNILSFLIPKKDVAFAYEDMTLRQAVEKMEHHRYSAVPMIKRSGEYVGTITAGDLLWEIKNNCSFNLKDAEDISLSSVPRSSDNLPAGINAGIDELLVRTLDQNFVPVVDDRGVFIGIVTRRSVMKYYYDSVKAK